MARAQDWDVIWGSSLVLLLEQLLLASGVSQLMPQLMPISPGNADYAGVGVDR